MVNIKSNREIEIMRECNGHVRDILISLVRRVEPGLPIIELDLAAEKLSLECGAKPAFKGYMGYRHSLCVSVNEQVVHGVPSKRKLKEGDIVGLDFGLSLHGYFGDSAVTVPVGRPSADAIQLMEITRASLYAGTRAAVAGNTVRDIARAIEQTVLPFGYGIVREFVVHGIGVKLHEDPQIPNYEAGAPNMKLKAGMTLAIEPMINQGTAEVRVLDDKWTAVTRDGKLSAHYEHTVVVLENASEILTEWPEGKIGVLDGYDFAKGEKV